MKYLFLLIALIFVLIFLFTRSFLYTVLTSPFIKRMSIYDLRARSLPNKNFKCKYVYAWHYYSTIRELNDDERVYLREGENKLNLKIMTPENPEKYPHTIDCYIILPYNFFTQLNNEERKRILRHEVVHIEQRKKNSGISSRRKPLREIEPLRRNNPDTDDLYYEGYMWKYSSEYPKNIDDVIKLSEYEHPFEEEAYLT